MSHQLHLGDLTAAAAFVGQSEQMLIQNLRSRTEINRFKVHELKEIMRCLKTKVAFAHLDFRLNARKEEMIQVLVDLFCKEGGEAKRTIPGQLAPAPQQPRPAMQQPDILARHGSFNCH
jgi:hypothetical protein